jgi:L-fuconolactonase
VTAGPTGGGRVDAHHHLWDLTTREHAWLDEPGYAPIRRSYGLAELQAVTAAAGVGRTVVVQTAHDAGETRELLALAGRSGGLVAGVVGWVDLASPAVADALAELREAPGGDLLVGVRHLAQDEPDPRWLERADVQRGIAAVGAAGLAFDVLVRPPQWPAALALARAVPQVRLVLDHAGKPPLAGAAPAAERLTGWTAWALQLAEPGNVVVKLSGLVTEADWSRWTVEDLRPVAGLLLERFGADRVLAGSDWPVCEVAADYQRVWRSVEELLAGASPGEREAVQAGTATAVYRLDARGGRP